MDCRERFAVEPAAKVRLDRIDPAFTGAHESHEKAEPEIQKHIARMDKLRHLQYGCRCGASGAAGQAAQGVAPRPSGAQEVRTIQPASRRP